MELLEESYGLYMKQRTLAFSAEFEESYLFFVSQAKMFLTRYLRDRRRNVPSLHTAVSTFCSPFVRLTSTSILHAEHIQGGLLPLFFYVINLIFGWLSWVWIRKFLSFSPPWFHTMKVLCTGHMMYMFLWSRLDSCLFRFLQQNLVTVALCGVYIMIYFIFEPQNVTLDGCCNMRVPKQTAGTCRERHILFLHHPHWHH